MKIQESAENYLEAILVLEKRIGNVRSIDVANHLEFTKPSVSIAMKKLRDSKLISISEQGFISLTENGKEIATKVYEKHDLISSWLVNIGVREDVACEDACRVEHYLSQESFDKIKEFLQSL